MSYMSQFAESAFLDDTLFICYTWFRNGHGIKRKGVLCPDEGPKIQRGTF